MACKTLISFTCRCFMMMMITRTYAGAGIRLACRDCGIVYADQIWPSCRLPAIDKVAVPHLCGSAAQPAIYMGLRVVTGAGRSLSTYYRLSQTYCMDITRHTGFTARPDCFVSRRRSRVACMIGAGAADQLLDFRDRLLFAVHSFPTPIR